MKSPNTKRGWPAGEPTEYWTAEQLLAYMRNQYKQLTASNGRTREAFGFTDDHIKEIAGR